MAKVTVNVKGTSHSEGKFTALIKEVKEAESKQGNDMLNVTCETEEGEIIARLPTSANAIFRLAELLDCLGYEQNRSGNITFDPKDLVGEYVGIVVEKQDQYVNVIQFYQIEEDEEDEEDEKSSRSTRGRKSKENTEAKSTRGRKTETKEEAPKRTRGRPKKEETAEKPVRQRRGRKKEKEITVNSIVSAYVEEDDEHPSTGKVVEIDKDIYIVEIDGEEMEFEKSELTLEA